MDDDARSGTQPPTPVVVGNTESDGNPAVGETRLYQPHIGSTPTTQDQQIGYSSSGTQFDMSNVSAALPDYTYRQMSSAMYQQPYGHPINHPSMQYPYHGNQYPAAIHNNYTASYPTQVQSPVYSGQRQYAPYQMNSNMGHGSQMFHGQPYFPQQGSMAPALQHPFPMAGQGQMFGQGGSPIYGTRGPNHYPATQVRVDSFGNAVTGVQTFQPGDMQGARRASSTSGLTVSSALRGPPRKPRQSGHALWVGNLPPGTNIIDLKDHFSRDATDDIESVFLISKSNCAFVNYKTEEKCAAAMTRFHDSRFNGVRLVCRLRRGSNPASTTATSSTTTGTSFDSRNNATESSSNVAQADEKQAQGENTQTGTKIKERFFIIKSLTVEDLERSVHSGIWATQSHNEEALNKAFQTAENVYLMFSANKSGEYFGYARMDSAIESESTVSVEAQSNDAQSPQQTSNASAAELPLTIPTPATNTAPRGYIIDDSARGTIFWEAEHVTTMQDTETLEPSPAHTDSGELSEDEALDSGAVASSSNNQSGQSTTFGKPFKITWICTDRLPFYRTRGLRNPWNTNREVKIARDGTELEPGVGRKLVGMFNANAGTNRAQSHGQYPGMMPSGPGQAPAYRPY